MKKLLSVLLVLLLACTLAACGGGASSAPSAAPAESTAAPSSAAAASEAEPAEPAEKAQVYVFIRERGDLSYWDSIAAGGDRAAESLSDKADVKVIETTTDLQASLTAMYEAADAGADMIITATDYKDNLLEIAEQYPDIACVIISEASIVEAAPNIYGIDFRSSEAAFLGGIVAADVASQGLEGTNASGVVGFIGGKEESVVIQEFFLGYIQGAKYYAEDTQIVYNYVGAFNDPDTARTQALAQYNDAGAEVIFACAGGSGNGVHTAAADTGKYVLGVDSDQTIMYENDDSIRSRFVTSVLKLVDNGVYVTIEEYVENGTLPFGTNRIMGIADDAVGLVENDLFKEYVSEEGIAKLAQAKEDISSGKVEIVGALGKDMEEIKALITEYIDG